MYVKKHYRTYGITTVADAHSATHPMISVTYEDDYRMYRQMYRQSSATAAARLSRCRPADDPRLLAQERSPVSDLRLGVWTTTHPPSGTGYPPPLSISHIPKIINSKFSAFSFMRSYRQRSHHGMDMLRAEVSCVATTPPEKPMSSLFIYKV